MGIAAIERQKLADALVAAGPAAPTLCEGWTARDLAAHVVLRDRRPDAALGLILPPLARHLDEVTKGLLAEDFDALVAKVRAGAAISPMRVTAIDNAVNTLEFAVHAEDVRRGAPGWEPLPRDAALDKVITSRLKIMRLVLARKSPVTVAFRTGDRLVAGPPDARVSVTGDPLELLLFFFGRHDAAQVTYDGAESDVLAVKKAKLSI